MVARFADEARAVNQIRHRNIIDIFAFGTLPNGASYFVMELLTGMTLQKYLKTNGPLDPGLMASLLWPVGRALIAAHKAGIAHRDLKPENVYLVMDQDGEMFPKLLDFGIAKLMGEEDMATRTKTGMVLGTPVYMSPEQCRATKVDHRADIYSFGIMIHEALAGSRPFDAENVMDVMMRQISDPPPRLSDVRPGLPKALDVPILRMLEKSPAKRPQTMQAALDELPGYGQTPGGPAVAPAGHGGYPPGRGAGGYPPGQAPGYPPGQAPGYPPGQGAGGYPPGQGAGPPPPYAAPTLQSAGHSPPQPQHALPRKAASPLGVFAALGAILFFLFVAGFIGFAILWGTDDTVEIGASVPAQGTFVDRDTTADFVMKLTAPGEGAPRITIQQKTHRWQRLTVRAVDAERVTRVDVQYGDHTQSTTTNEGSHSQPMVPANRTFVATARGADIEVTSPDGQPVTEEEIEEVVDDAGPLFHPLTEVFSQPLSVGDTVRVPSDVMLELLGFRTPEPGTTMRADNATLKLLTIDPGGERATFEVSFFFVEDGTSPPLHAQGPMKGTFSVAVSLQAAAELRLHLGAEGAQVFFGQEAQHVERERERLVIPVEVREALLGGQAGEALLGGHAGEALLGGHAGEALLGGHAGEALLGGQGLDELSHHLVVAFHVLNAHLSLLRAHGFCPEPAGLRRGRLSVPERV
jgi:hypothetical protein